MSTDVRTLTITPHNPISSRGIYYFARGYAVINVLLCIFFIVITCKPSFAIGSPQQLHGSIPCGVSKGNHDSALSENGLDAGCIRDNQKVLTSHSNVCANSEMFCFTSTLRDISSERHNNVEVTSVAESFDDDVLPEAGASQSYDHASNSSWLSDRGMSVLLNGRTVECSLSAGNSISDFPYIRGNSTSTIYKNGISSCRGPLFNPSSASATFSMDDVEMIKSSPDVEISPPVLDWGETFLYVPSFAFITVTNNWKDRVLNVYLPISLDAQFFPFNFTEAVLGPDEVLSLCFVFLPKSPGSSSAHLILQTSSGGFLIQGKGYALDSPYGFKPLLGSSVSASGSWRKNLSLFNPFNENVRVEDITIWLSTEQGACQIEAMCSSKSFSDSSDVRLMVKDWFLVRTSPVELSSHMALRLHRNWEITPQDSAKIVELDFSLGSAGKVLGAFCMQLTRLSQHMTDIIVIPIEVEVDDSLRRNDVTGFITVSLERLGNSEAGGGVVAISLRNSRQSVIRVLNISDIASAGSFHIKYIEGLLLFPSTVTQVAVVTCACYLNEDCEFAQETYNVDENCKLLVQTNDSTSQIEIPCQDILHLCNGKDDQYGGSKHQSNSFGLGDKQTVSSDLLTSPSKVKMDSDEMILRNWIAQGSDTGSSILDDDEVFFNMVPIGSHHSKWITVHNPSQHPVIMQLLLNPGEIIDNCKDKINGLAGLVSPGRSLISESSVRIRDGFSLADGAISEAIVHPFDNVSLGPLIFHPSKRCEWKSSVLVRNNLSGVEWFPVRGKGGSQALAIFEGAKPAREIEFELKSPNSLGRLGPNPASSQPCSGPLTKVLSIVNLGDLTLEVLRITVSGTDCGSAGFVVPNCSYFSIQPGESATLPISYQSKFLAPLVRRDLELALASGIFILPLKATIPIVVMGECRRTLFWSRAKKIFVAVLVAAPCAFFVFCYFYPHSLGLCAPNFISNGDGGTIPATTHKLVKSSKVQYSKKCSRFTFSTKAKHMPSLVIDDKALLLRPDNNCMACEEHGMKVDDGETLSHIENTMLAKEKLAEEEESPSSLEQAENGVPGEPTLPSNLTILIGKEKRRRRRKRKGTSPGLSALMEVSSSHSGNSTPSSPLSPLSSTTPTPQRAWPKPIDVEQCLETHKSKSRTPEPIRSQYSPQPFARDKAAAPTPPARPRTAARPVLLPSATFPSSSHHLSSTARIALHARAPGSRLCAETAANSEDKAKKTCNSGTEFTYDIWGDHFSAIGQIGKGRYRDVEHATMPHSVGIVDIDDSDNSFFVKGPQALLTKYRPETSISNEK
ncbi:hypothetical protein MLD38_031466 [Melastoma candidum]|uniref:Uncharacterized protein n=1 Tax=Melastoma candidum TaxID=119954 RepID=A0ACB9MPK3_9MYRT|nr:hypothetical protein MLD38_031466 [Melastoma candidum]